MINIWSEQMLNIVVPMAGRGSRFAKEGYALPKPLIDVNGKHMIEVVINNLTPKCDHRFIFVCQNEHIEKYNLDTVFRKVCKNFEVIGIDGVTEGAAITVLKARNFFDNNNPLIIRPLGAGQTLLNGHGIRSICTPTTATSIRWGCSVWGEN